MPQLASVMSQVLQMQLTYKAGLIYLLFTCIPNVDWEIRHLSHTNVKTVGNENYPFFLSMALMTSSYTAQQIVHSPLTPLYPCT